MRWEIAAGLRFGTGRPWARLTEVPLLHAGDLLIALISLPGCSTASGRRRQSSRVRAGANRAVDQPQWGNYGDLLECVWLAVDRAGAHLDPASADLLEALGNRVCDSWTEPDCRLLGRP